MIYFKLPRINSAIYKYIDYVKKDEDTDGVFDGNPHTNASSGPEIHPRMCGVKYSNSLAEYLYEIKNKIKFYEKEWDKYKKYTNPYEFINTLVPGKNKCVSKYRPLSRSYFKMIELLHFFIYDETATTGKTPIRTFHLAEGPGGFIEAVVNTRNNPADVYVGMTILYDTVTNSGGETVQRFVTEDHSKKNQTVPGWKKSDYFLKSHPNVQIETGADKTGNILSIENFLYCREKYGSSMHLITGDGGFDFSVDFNNQEINIRHLLFGQMCYALCLQKRGGNFILKTFDCFMEHTVDILYILSAFYENVYITKPKTSRYANSEKYIVCKNFILFNDSAIFPYLKNAFYKMTVNMLKETRRSNSLGDYERKHKPGSIALKKDGAVDSWSDGQAEPEEWPTETYRFLKVPIPSYFIYKIEEYNAIFGQQQIENIYQTIALIEQHVNHDSLCEYPGERRSGLHHHPKNVVTSADHTKKFANFNQNRSHTVLSDLSEKLEALVRSNIRKCVQWCNYHNIAYNVIDDIY